MKTCIRINIFLVLLLAPLSAAYSQNNETVVRPMELSFFGGGGGTLIGINTGNNSQGKNIDITAGASLGFGNLTYHGFLPAIEIRGTYPIDSGRYASEENFLGGLKVERPYRSFHPYADALFGRGELTYSGKGSLNPDKTVLYQKSNSNVLAGGVGVDYDVLTSFALKVDVQFEHYSDVPVVKSDSATATSVIIGVVYRFGYRDRYAY